MKHTPIKTKAVILTIIAIAALVAGTAFLTSLSPAKTWGPHAFADLATAEEQDLADVDVALMNLLCAEGLPGAENLDVKQCLLVLDQWAEVVRQSEGQYLPQFQRNAARYDNSLAKFKAVNLGLTLKQDLGCGYNKDLVTSGAMAQINSTLFFKDSSDVFLHGFIEKRKGSCASLPVLMVAVGRRCGYPLHLVSCKGHLFCRWEDSRETFNIETAIEGVDSTPDSYYRRWPYPCTDAELRTEKYVKTLTRAEELGIFAQLRAACLEENRRFPEAVQAYELALRFFPNSKYISAYLNRVRAKADEVQKPGLAYQPVTQRTPIQQTQYKGRP